MLNLNRRVQNICRMSLHLPENLTQPEQLPQGPKFVLVCPETRFAWHTSAKSCSTLIFFPFASYMIGFVPRSTLHTLRRMVVLPAFAFPMTRMRNWGHSRRISPGSKAPSLNGRASLDEWASWFSADMQERRSALWVWRLGSGQRLTSGVIGSRIVFPFPDEIETVTPTDAAFSKAALLWTPKKSLTIYWQTPFPSRPRSSSISPVMIYPRYREFEIDPLTIQNIANSWRPQSLAEQTQRLIWRSLVACDFFFYLVFLICSWSLLPFHGLLAKRSRFGPFVHPS